MSILLKRSCFYAVKSYSNYFPCLLRTRVSTPATAVKPIDNAAAAFKNLPNAVGVLSAVQSHLPGMTYENMLQALRILFELHKEGKLNITPEELLKDPSFKMLCHNFTKHARDIEVGDAIEATKVLCFLGVPVNSAIIQNMLQIIRHNINTLNLRQIMFLDFLLSRFEEKNHLVDALKLALPLAFQIHLPLELDKDDLPMLRDMLMYSTMHDLPDRCINNVVTGILLHKELDVKTAKSIIWALSATNCTMEVYPTRAQLLNACFDIVAKNINDLNFKEVLKTITLIKSRVTEKHPEFYHEELMDAVAQYAVNQKLDFEKSLLIARALTRIAHTNFGLVDYLCQLGSTHGVLSSARPNIIFAFVNCLANHNYKPDPALWWEIQKEITKNPIIDSDNTALPWAKFALELAALGIYDERILKKVSSMQFLQQFLDRNDNSLDYLQLLTLHEAVRAFYSSKFTLPEAILEKAKELYPASSLSERIIPYLVQGLGGPEYVAKNVVLASGIVANIVTCIQHGRPVPLQDVRNKVPLEKHDLPDDSVMVCFMMFNQGSYSMNSNRLRGTLRLILDVLERQGYATIGFNINEFFKLPTFERTPYLMREVEYKCNEYGIKLRVDKEC